MNARNRIRPSTDSAHKAGSLLIRWLWLLMAASILLKGSAAPGNPSRLPSRELNLRLTAPIKTWDEAIPLGNGLQGGLLWGEGNLVRLSLDRGDLWDERPAPGNALGRFTYAQLVKLVAENKNDDIRDIADRRGYDQPHPTKLPAGRLEITLDETQQLKEFELDLAAAEGRAWFSSGARLDAFFSAAAPVALLRLPGLSLKSLRLIPPAAVRKLGYPDASSGSEGALQWFVQEAAEGLTFCVCVGSRSKAGSTLLAVTVASTADGPDPVKTACRRVRGALAAGYEKMLRPHWAYWGDFWSKSQLWVPAPEVLRHYYLVQYFYGAASRRGAPPMPLQGVWTADDGNLPPWKGDYHHDLNTQMTYMGYQTAGRFEEGAAFLDFLWQRLPVFRRFARDFFGTPGANVPGVMSLGGQPLGGWAQYSLAPTPSAWLAHLFYLHWRYTADARFLRARAYPWCCEVGEGLAALLRPDERGVLKLPTSSSPEIHDNSQRAWLRPNSTYDLALLRMLFLSLKEMATALGKGAQAARWSQLAHGLGDFSTEPNGALMLSADEPFRASHRHFSNLMNVYPFNLDTTDGSERQRQIIRASVDQYDQYGTAAWCGYSFAWMAALRARVGDADAAARNLEIFVKAFILRNGFHANGDQTKSGFSTFTYRPFTLEGNFLAGAALHEMLLQSWSPRPGSGEPGIIRLFPAMPSRWHQASFQDLRAEGGYRVSARRDNSATSWLRVLAARDGWVKIRDNFAGRPLTWSRPGVRKTGDNFEVYLKRGQSIEGSLSGPAGN